MVALGAVKAVPDSCSVYRLPGTRRGLFRPPGKVDGSASLSWWLAKPFKYVRPSWVTVFCDAEVVDEAGGDLSVILLIFKKQAIELGEERAAS